METKTRKEHDLIGEKEIPADCYYGIQTSRAIENFNISRVKLFLFPELIDALAIVKSACAKANEKLGLLDKTKAIAIVQACDEIIAGKLHSFFKVDMVQGGAGTSTNMNANEVIANRAIELMGGIKGDYKICHPNNHVNMSQSTNDAYPTAVKIALLKSSNALIDCLVELKAAFRNKQTEFAGIIKMGRTQLQDAVPMTLGQTFGTFAQSIEDEIENLEREAKQFLEVNIGGTAIGTGINADPDFGKTCVTYLKEISGYDIFLAPDLIEETQDTGAYVSYSSAMKRTAVKLSKICNDLRLLSSGPRAGIYEITLPAMQPGSSIMPGKVNPVIPEVVNQIAFKIIGNDLTVTLAAEAGQLELNVMEPIIVYSIFESTEMLKNGIHSLIKNCIFGIKANAQRCREMVEKSIGLVTALNPYIGYEASTQIAKEALEFNKSVYQLVLEKKLLTKEKLDSILSPENMTKPHKIINIPG